MTTTDHIAFMAIFSGSQVTANNPNIMTNRSGIAPLRKNIHWLFNQPLIALIIPLSSLKSHMQYRYLKHKLD